MNMEHVYGLKLILKAIENEGKEKMFNKWLHDDARYTTSFDEYVRLLTPYRASTKNEKERILEKYGGGLIGSI